MKKAIFLPIIFVLFSSGVAAETIYKNKIGAYQFTIPQGWIVHKENQKGADVFIVPQGRRRGVIFTLAQKPRGSLDKDISKKKIRRLLYSKNKTINGARCLQQSFILSSGNHHIVIACPFNYLAKDKKVVPFTFMVALTVSAKYKSKIEPVYWRVVRALKFPRFVTPRKYY